MSVGTIMHLYAPVNPVFNQFVIRQIRPPLVVAWRFIASPYKTDDVLVEYWSPGNIGEHAAHGHTLFSTIWVVPSHIDLMLYLFEEHMSFYIL